MKIKVTKKYIRKNSNKVIKLHYCEAQTLLRYEDPFAYSSGQNGWACDYYDINHIIISTGYSPIGDNVDHELISEYEEKAQKIVYNNYNESYESKKNKVTKLLKEFINIVKK